MKTLLIKLKNLYIQYTWISIMKKGGEDVKVEKMVIFVHLTITTTNLILAIFSYCKRIWNWNLDGNLIVGLQIRVANYTVLLEKLYTTLR